MMEDIHLEFSKTRQGRSLSYQYCKEHDSEKTYPVLTVEDQLSSSRNRILHEEVSLEPFLVKVIHSSDRSPDFHPVIRMRLVTQLPSGLVTVHTKISVEGRLFTG